MSFLVFLSCFVEVFLSVSLFHSFGVGVFLSVFLCFLLSSCLRVFRSCFLSFGRLFVPACALCRQPKTKNKCKTKTRKYTKQNTVPILNPKPQTLSPVSTIEQGSKAAAAGLGADACFGVVLGSSHEGLKRWDEGR